MGKKQKADIIQFNYLFRFENGREKKFILRLRRDDLSYILPEIKEIPDWALLKNFRCEHCPLDENVVKHCPVAVNIVDIINEFHDLPSFENAEVLVQSANRSYHKKTSLQSGVSSMMGIRMVSSGCPVMGKLKPMLHFHLPFATLEETQVRALSIYLLAQYVKNKKGGYPDWEMEGLVRIYEDIRVLNLNVSRKIADLEDKDTSINSLVILNNFADYVTFTIDEFMIDDLVTYVKEFM